MKSDDVLRPLRAAERALRERGVAHAALFGSVARGEERADSDIDILVDLDPEVVRTIYDYAGVKSYIAEMFGGAVDVVDRSFYAVAHALEMIFKASRSQHPSSIKTSRAQVWISLWGSAPTPRKRPPAF